LNIAELSAFHVHIPLRRPIRHASHARTETENLVVRCVLQDGTVGYGEGVPRDYVTGETIESDFDLLRESRLPEQFIECHQFAEALALAERLELSRPPNDERGCHGNAARCAVELAILDAYGRYFGHPLSDATRLLTPDVCAAQPWVRYSGAITSARGTKLRLATLGMRLFGFQQLKVKVGLAGHDDVGRLRAVRGLAGRKMDLRIDANEAWPPDEVVERIQALEPFGITSVEQPVAHGLVGCLKQVREQVRVPIMLDESLCSRSDAERAAGDGLCDLFNLRLSKCGGFIPTLRLVQLAKSRGLGYQLGCQVGETAILSAAGRHFATSVAGIRYLEGSYDRYLVRESLGKTDLTFRLGGWAPALKGPGLGVDVDPERLEHVTLRKETLLG
jgi:muconate cycloisomerase